MSIKDPIDLKLTEGGVGEVLPAEMWQDKADFHRSAVDHLKRDHNEAIGGAPVHTGLRWARAAAIVQIPEPIDPNGGEARVVTAVGFRTRPSLKFGEWDSGFGVYGNAWYLEWEIEGRGPQFIQHGRMLRDINGPTSYEEQTFPMDMGESIGRLYLGRWEQDMEGEWHPLDTLRNLKSVSLLIR